MSRNVDTDLINTRSREIERVIQDGRFIEGITAEGKTPEGLLSAAKEALGIEEGDSIMLKYNEKLGELNVQTKAFISLANFTSKAEETNLLTADELSSIKLIEEKLAKEISEKYGIDLEDLYDGEL